ncbi:hypothetical protein [Tautonia sociabilis]|uniref:Uncharacterized protein n=1 Tax=Tautonia sociabilis TaxID=2080755 RepID=A0A432MJL5_9BACT|nr:hypothetical protein [Tautonia sociabilis]RUL87439.1 hypothetical protein TsocGM_12215 [Tautonia sociabilis]
MFLPVALALLTTPPGPVARPGHEENAVFQAVTAEGLAVGGRVERLPAPTFADGQSADQQREALRNLASSNRAVENFLRDSVSAPFLLSLRDVDVEGATVRAGDLYFALRVDLDEVDVAELFGIDAFGPFEAANMRFEARAIDPQGAGDDDPDAPRERFLHSEGRLLDRISVESTSRVMASRSGASVVVASRTDPSFDGHDRWPNRWRTIQGRGANERFGPSLPFAGGIGYAKLTRMLDRPEIALVELHFAFAEPTDWFDGAPILRSKFTLIAQDQIRRIRRELNQRREGR